MTLAVVPIWISGSIYDGRAWPGDCSQGRTPGIRMASIVYGLGDFLTLKILAEGSLFDRLGSWAFRSLHRLPFVSRMAKDW